MTKPNETQDQDAGLQESEEGGSVPAEAEVPEGAEVDAPDEDTETEPGPDESGEQGEEVEESEDGESEDDTDAESQDDAEEEPEDDTLQTLQRRAEEQSAVNAKLLELISARAEKPKPKVDDFADVPDDLMRLALFGGATEQSLARFTPAQIERAKLAADAHAQRQIRYVRNPAAMLEDLREKVQELVNSRVRPIEEDYTQRRANELADRYFKKHDKNVQARIKETFNAMPGSDSGDWKVIESNLKLAERLAMLEVQTKGSKAEGLKKTAKKVQKIAAGGGKLKGNVVARGNGSSKPARAPVKSDDETYEQFGKRLAKYYAAGGK